MEEYRDEFLTPEDLEEEQKFFSLLFDLEAANASRYEQQAIELINSRVMTTEFQNQILAFKLDRVGCSFSISQDQGKTFNKLAWTRLGWRNSDKLIGLPLFFANCEARVLLEK